MRAAGIHPDIAADHAGELAGRVGRIEEALLLHRLDPAAEAGTGATATHPSDPARAAVVLATLGRLPRAEPTGVTPHS